MSLTRLAVHRPVTTLMCSLMVVLLGVVSLGQLSVDLMPDVTYPTITVTTLYRGAGPEEVETQLTRPIEQAVSAVHGVEQVSSVSAEGSSSVRLRMRWGTPMDAAIADIRQALGRLQADLPRGSEPSYIRKYDSADSPIIYLGLHSDLSLIELTRLGETVVLPRLERVDGVARVRLRGGSRRQIHVNLNLDQMSARELGVNEVIDGLRQQNVNRPAGNFNDGNVNRLIRARGEFVDLGQIADTTLRTADGASVQVSDVSEVIDSTEERTEITRLNGEEAVLIYVYKQAGANTVQVSEAVHEAVADLNLQLKTADVAVRIDRADYIRQSINNVQSAAGLGMLLAAVVLLVFLRSWRSAIVIALSMPLAMLATFTLIYFKGFTLNLVSFGGLALGIGLLVDNSIVVIESIYRARAEGHSATEAAVRGTAEVATAIIASTLTTLIVFVPLMFIQGMTAILLHQLAWVVSFSLMCSLVFSLTLTPALTAWLFRRETGKDACDTTHELKPQASQPKGERGLAGLLQRGFEFVERIYAAVLKFSLRWSSVVGAALLLLFAISVGQIPRIGSEFLPKTDEGSLRVWAQMAAGIQLPALERQSLKIEKAVGTSIPNVVSSAAFIGGDADDADEWNQADFRITLPRKSERDTDIETLRSRLADGIGAVPGMKVRVRASRESGMFRMLSRSGADLEVQIRGHDLKKAELLARQIGERMEEIAGFVNVRVEIGDRRPETAVNIDRTKASLAGVSVEDIVTTLETTVGGVPATVYSEDGVQSDVLVRLREDDRQTLNHIKRVDIATSSGQLIPLSSLVKFDRSDAPMVINRQDRQRTIEVSADVVDRDFGGAVAELQGNLERLPMPRDFSWTIGGQWEEQQKSFAALRWGFLLALTLMYMVMASQFESLRDPLLILVTVPLAAVGVIFTMRLTGTTLNVQSFIGMVMLAGIVVNNGIVLIDYAKRLRQEQPELEHTEVVVRAAVRRFRPILMTTLTTILAMLPIAFGWGEGGELQAPMARVVIGGLFSGTLITLLAIPLLIHAWQPARAKEKVS